MPQSVKTSYDGLVTNSLNYTIKYGYSQRIYCLSSYFIYSKIMPQAKISLLCYDLKNALRSRAMSLSKSHKQVALKALLAIVMLSGLAGVAGSQLAPDMPLLTILLNCAIWAAVMFVALIFVAVLSLTFNQFILRHGGTDADWFWFKGEPPGLERQREQLKAQKE
jgi:hypothetical protein